jgi:hypothetical protein
LMGEGKYHGKTTTNLLVFTYKLYHISLHTNFEITVKHV